MMEHATQFPGEYSKVAGVTKKVRKESSSHNQALIPHGMAEHSSG